MYGYESRIGFSHCDATKKLELTGLIDMMQDCSTFHSEDLGVGFDELEKRDFGWVINYWEIDIYRLPRMCERVTVGTFPHEVKGYFAYRNFCVKKDGEFLVKANTMWTFLNMKTGTPARIPEDIRTAYTLEEKLDMDYGPRNVDIPEGCEHYEGEPIRVMPHHLDGNKHVNNGQYVKLGLAAIEDETDISKCKRFRIDYRKQAKLGDTIIPVIYRGETITIALNNEDGEAYSVMEITL